MFYTTQKTSPEPVMEISPPPKNNIVMNAAGTEMLRITEHGFYIRGERVPVDEKEAAEVYTAFKQWLTWHTLTS